MPSGGLAERSLGKSPTISFKGECVNEPEIEEVRDWLNGLPYDLMGEIALTFGW